MAAYYHILIPFEIAIQENAELEKQFNDLYGGDFTFKHDLWIERFSPELPNGRRLDFSYNEKTFVLSDGIIRREFLEFSRLFFEEWNHLYETKFKGKFPATQMQPEELELQLNDVKSLIDRYPLASDELEEELRDMDNNYYFAIEPIVPQVVYQGYPIKTDKHTSLLALDLLHSYEKMGIYPEEYAAMFMLVDGIKEKYSEQFTMAKYLFIAGY